MATLWDDIAKTIREGVDTVVEKTEELTKIGKIKVDIINLKRSVDKNFSELGGKVYHLILDGNKTQIASDSDVKEIVERVKKLEAQLDEKNEALERVKTKTPATQPAKAPAEQQAEAVS
ncbi:MAG: hypothetical protein ACE5IY_16865 [bacterium]